MLKWLGISVYDSLASTRMKFLIDTRDKLELAMQKLLQIVVVLADRDWLSCILIFVTMSFCLRPGLYPIFTKIDLKQMRVNYFCYYKFLLYLPKSAHNRRLVDFYGATEMLCSLENLQTYIGADACFGLGAHHSFIRFFH